MIFKILISDSLIIILFSDMPAGGLEQTVLQLLDALVLWPYGQYLYSVACCFVRSKENLFIMAVL